MSMMDETPYYFVRNGKIYAHHDGSSYYSSGFYYSSGYREHEPSYNQELTKATQRNINYYLENNSIYSYDEHKWLTQIQSNYKDAFDNSIFIDDTVLFMDCYKNGRFAGYMKGKVIGFTKEFVKIKLTKRDRIDECSDLGRYEWYRAPHRIVVLE